jgi:hypothetical protein
MTTAKTNQVTMFGPDFPFAFNDWFGHSAGAWRDSGRAPRGELRSSALASPG